MYAAIFPALQGVSVTHRVQRARVQGDQAQSGPAALRPLHQLSAPRFWDGRSDTDVRSKRQNLLHCQSIRGRHGRHAQELGVSPVGLCLVRSPRPASNRERGATGTSARRCSCSDSVSRYARRLSTNTSIWSTVSRLDVRAVVFSLACGTQRPELRRWWRGDAGDGGTTSVQ